MDDKWRTIPCQKCGGLGVVSVYSAFDFEGPGECPDCINGSLWLRPSGHAFLYPGGPAAGMVSRVTYEIATLERDGS